MTYYVGGEISQADLLGANARYFYALRRADDGTVYFDKIDQLASDNATITINIPGPPEDNFNDFDYNADFFDGRLADHTRPHPNLFIDQYRWDNRNCFYYINDNGEFVVRINQAYVYS